MEIQIRCAVYGDDGNKVTVWSEYHTAKPDDIFKNVAILDFPEVCQSSLTLIVGNHSGKYLWTCGYRYREMLRFMASHVDDWNWEGLPTDPKSDEIQSLKPKLEALATEWEGMEFDW